VNDARLVLRQAGYGLLVLSRSARTLVFTVIFPIILLVVFGSIFNKNGGDSTTLQNGAKITLQAYFTGGILAYAISMNAFASLAISITTQREAGMLKRFRGTPVPSWTFLAGLILRSIAIIAAMSVILLALAGLAYHVTLTPTRIAYIALFVVLGTAALAALGIGLTAFTTSADSASAIAPFATVLLSFISGVFVQTSALPQGLVDVGRVFPLAHLADGMQSALASGTPHLSGGNVLSLALWGAAGIWIAARRFQWQPRAAAA
jgi:ABC-2 type transport system permease protein